MRLRWSTLCAALAVSISMVQACMSDESDDEDCGHLSLLQTSAQITKSESTKLQPGSHQLAKGHTLSSLSTLSSVHGSRSDAQSHTAFFLANAMLVVAIVALFACLRQATARDDRLDVADQSDREVRFPCSFDEDVYMMAIGLISRDLYQIAKGTKNNHLPSLRIGYAVLMTAATVSMQLALLWCTKAYVTPQQVASIRDSYDAYEQHMYGGESNTRLLYTGNHRGLPEHFRPELFETLDDDVKGDVCQIPFSQMKFLVFILMIWTTTCAAQLSRCVLFMWNLLVCLPTISSMEYSIRCGRADKPRRKWCIIGLTLQVKLLALMLVFLPWLMSTCYLCWLGCRWLSATNDFGNFVSNAMALEFILQFKSLMYYAVCSERTKRDLQNMRYLPPSKTEEASFLSYFNALAWGALAVAWVYAYIFHLQHVLPEYQWDVHEPCTPFLMGQLRPATG